MDGITLSTGRWIVTGTDGVLRGQESNSRAMVEAVSPSHYKRIETDLGE
jgi:hypothetical protein